MKDLFLNSKQPIVAGERTIPEKNLYRLSFRDEQGNMRECEVTASTMSLAVRGNNEPFELVKVERIYPSKARCQPLHFWCKEHDQQTKTAPVLLRKYMNMALDWMPYGGGYLAKPSHGYYLVRKKYDPEMKSNLWFAQYEAKEMFDRPVTTIDLQGFDSLEQAQAACEKHAQGYSSGV